MVKKKPRAGAEDGWSPPYFLLFLYMLAALASLLYRPAGSGPRAEDIGCVRIMLSAINGTAAPDAICPKIGTGYLKTTDENGTWISCPDPWEHLPFGPRFALAGKGGIALDISDAGTAPATGIWADRDWRIEISGSAAGAAVRSGPRGYLRYLVGPVLAITGTILALAFGIFGITLWFGDPSAEDSGATGAESPTSTGEKAFMVGLVIGILVLAGGSAWQGARLALGDRETVIADNGQIFIRPAPFLGFSFRKPRGAGRAVVALPLRDGKELGVAVFTDRDEILWIKLPRAGESAIPVLIRELSPALPAIFSR